MLAVLCEEFKTVISDYFDLTTTSSKIFFYTKSTIDQEAIFLITDHPQTVNWSKFYLDLNTITDKAESGLGINFNQVYNLDGFFWNLWSRNLSSTCWFRIKKSYF